MRKGNGYKPGRPGDATPPSRKNPAREPGLQGMAAERHADRETRAAVLSAPKEAMRQAIQVKRSRLTPDWTEENSRKVVDHLRRLEPIAAAETIAAYYEKGAEVRIRPFLEERMGMGGRVCVPRHRDDAPGYEWCWVSPGDAWRDGPWKVAEPAGRQPADPADIQVALVPAVAVDREGRRLGHGGGHFDRLMAELTCPRIAVVFEFQLLDEIPADTHDVPVDFIVTEKGTYPAEDRTSDAV